MKSKTDQAIDYMKEHGISAYAAARLFGISTKVIYTRVKLLEETASRRCPCCGQLVKDPSKLKETP